jgi:hypothetical protein
MGRSPTPLKGWDVSDTPSLPFTALAAYRPANSPNTHTHTPSTYESEHAASLQAVEHWHAKPPTIAPEPSELARLLERHCATRLLDGTVC